jgi:ribosome recycling factor
VSEDMTKNAEDEIQELTDKHIKAIDEIYATKEAEIMTV